MKYLMIEYRLLVYFTSFTVCSGDIKKNKNKKKLSENDQSTFQSFFFHPPHPTPYTMLTHGTYCTLGKPKDGKR